VAGNRLKVAYRWRSENQWSGIGLETDGNSALPGEGSVEQFITEHYWGYAVQPGGGCVEYRVAHPPWRVWQVRQSVFEGDAEKIYGKDIAAVLRARPQSAFLAEGSPVTVMRGEDYDCAGERRNPTAGHGCAWRGSWRRSLRRTLWLLRALGEVLGGNSPAARIRDCRAGGALGCRKA